MSWGRQKYEDLWSCLRSQGHPSTTETVVNTGTTSSSVHLAGLFVSCLLCKQVHQGQRRRPWEPAQPQAHSDSCRAAGFAEGGVGCAGGDDGRDTRRSKKLVLVYRPETGGRRDSASGARDANDPAEAAASEDDAAGNRYGYPWRKEVEERCLVMRILLLSCFF